MTASTQSTDAGFFAAISRYLRMIKFAHSIFALPFAGIAFVLALPGSGLWSGDGPAAGFYLLIVQIIICMVSLRSAAMGFNRLVDRKYDAANLRTEKREIPAGEISVVNVKLFIGASLSLFFAAAFWINPLCGFLSPPAALLVLGYSYTKRFTMFCHFVLGLAIGISPTGAWLAVQGEFALLPVIWSGALMFYIAGFDILYSCQDADFDREAGLRSIPADLGIPAALWIARFSHLVAIVLFSLAGFLAGSGSVYMITTVIVGGLFILEHSMVRPGKLENIPIAFFHVNASISSILFLGLLLDIFFKHSF